MKVMKFGGAVLGSKEGFFAMARILDSFSGDNVLIVISALSKTTSLLKQAAYLSESGNIVKASEISDDIINSHILLADSLLPDSKANHSVKKEFSKIKSSIGTYLNGIYVTGDLSLRTLDKIMSFGEMLALILSSEFLLSQGIELKLADSTEIIKTNNNYGYAEPLIEQTISNIKSRIMPLFENYRAIITQGFVASADSGDITTMGIESSNLSAAIYASAFECDELMIWTDVEGIRTADPKLTKNTISIPYINITDAKKASDCGLKLIYPSMLEYAEKSNFKITFRSAFNPDGDYTEISRNNSGIDYTILICNQHQTLYTSTDKNYLADFTNTKWIFDMPDCLNAVVDYPVSRNLSLNGDKLKSQNNLSMVTVLKNPAVNSQIFSILSEFSHSSKIKSIIFFSDDSLKILAPDDISVALITFLHKRLVEESYEKN